MDIITINQTVEFSHWLKNIKDKATRQILARRLERIATTGNFGDTKPIGNAIYELREHKSPGWRIYYTYEATNGMRLLWGGTKGSQSKDILKAKKLADI